MSRLFFQVAEKTTFDFALYSLFCHKNRQVMFVIFLNNNINNLELRKRFIGGDSTVGAIS